MNKAFVKEPDPSASGSCPLCGSLGQPVGPETLAAHLPPEALRNLSESAYFCPYDKCAAAYFDMFERVVRAEQLVKRVYPKDLDAPLCACFGLTRDDVEQDIREGGATRVKELLAKARSPAARCRTQAANGQSCVAEVQRSYMRMKGTQ